MRFKKGMKLTEEEKAQNRASREANKARSLERWKQEEEQRSTKKAEDHAFWERIQAGIAETRADIRRLEEEANRCLVIQPTHAQKRALIEFFKRHEFQNRCRDDDYTMARVGLRWLLQTALPWIAEISTRADALACYRDAEGFGANKSEEYSDCLITSALERWAAQRAKNDIQDEDDE